MFNLEIDDVDVVVFRRVLLQYAIDLEMTQAKIEAEDGGHNVISERGNRFIDYAQQLGSYAKEGGKK